MNAISPNVLKSASMIPANPYRFARNCFNSSQCEANGHTGHDSAAIGRARPSINGYFCLEGMAQTIGNVCDYLF
jgi:hypothetical protein